VAVVAVYEAATENEDNAEETLTYPELVGRLYDMRPLATPPIIATNAMS